MIFRRFPKISAWLVGGVVIALLWILAVRILGVERVLKEGSFAPSNLFAGVEASICLVGGILAGNICYRLTRSQSDCNRLAFVMLWIATFASNGRGMRGLSEPPPRPEGLTGSALVRQVAHYRYRPFWLKLAQGLATGGGVVLGAWLLAPRRRREQDDWEDVGGSTRSSDEPDAEPNADPNVPIPIDFYFQFPGEEAARAFAESLTKEGYAWNGSFYTHPDEGNDEGAAGCFVRLRRTERPDPAALDRQCRELHERASRTGGRFDECGPAPEAPE
ncbi:MAG: ribonuclease E inhibitor RraB [Planctomycetota bacterium]